MNKLFLALTISTLPLNALADSSAISASQPADTVQITKPANAVLAARSEVRKPTVLQPSLKAIRVDTKETQKAAHRSPEKKAQQHLQHLETMANKIEKQKVDLEKSHRHLMSISEATKNHLKALEDTKNQVQTMTTRINKLTQEAIDRNKLAQYKQILADIATQQKKIWLNIGHLNFEAEKIHEQIKSAAIQIKNQMSELKHNKNELQLFAAMPPPSDPQHRSLLDRRERRELEQDRREFLSGQSNLAQQQITAAHSIQTQLKMASNATSDLNEAVSVNSSMIQQINNQYHNVGQNLLPSLNKLSDQSMLSAQQIAQQLENQLQIMSSLINSEQQAIDNMK